jgi:hypothetical protein
MMRPDVPSEGVPARASDEVGGFEGLLRAQAGRKQKQTDGQMRFHE